MPKYYQSAENQSAEMTILQKKKEYPQVRKTGVDAVYEKLPTEGPYHEETVIYFDDFELVLLSSLLLSSY